MFYMDRNRATLTRSEMAFDGVYLYISTCLLSFIHLRISAR